MNYGFPNFLIIGNIHQSLSVDFKTTCCVLWWYIIYILKFLCLLLEENLDNITHLMSCVQLP